MHTLSRVFAFAVSFLFTVPAFAFCGFFVGNTTGLYNDATQVVLMRVDQYTVTTMKPTYDGPIKDFAMVIPVEQVLTQDDVRVLEDAGPIREVEKLSAPRLVEYYEEDPCIHHKGAYGFGMQGSGRGGGAFGGVRVKARFERGEYEIVILDADESTQLEGWLNENGYKQPKGAAKYLAPYVQQGMYFFAAKVNVDKVKRVDGKPVLSPLQFRYESEAFRLPIRLGMLNARGPQELLVFVLGKSRYEVANRRNLFIPTNIDVSAKRKKDFADWYRGLFDRTLENRESSVVTEYVWPTAMKCDPCPPGATRLQSKSIRELGGKLLSGRAETSGLILTRLHTRYDRTTGTSDLVFAKAKPVVGGREVEVDGELEKGAREGKRNAFQARYSIRYRYKGELTCDDPNFFNWHGSRVSGTANFTPQ